MLRTVTPRGGLFQTMNPLNQNILEGVFAIAVVVLLALPFVIQIQRLRFEQEDAQKGTRKVQRMKFHSSNLENSDLMTHYPNFESSHESLSGSSILFDMSSIQDIQVSQSNRFQNSEFTHHFDNFETSKPLFMDSSIYMENNTDVPHIDSINFDYHTYRYKLLEEVLKKYYAEHQPPGQVVMNSIHLNRMDGSKVNTKAYDQDIFEFVGKLYGSLEILKSQELQYMHPFDHFLMKGPKRIPTEEKCIATKNPSLWSVPDMMSDILLNSAKNVGDTTTHAKTSHGYRNRLEVSSRTDHHIRPLTAGESSSDICSSLNDTNNDAKQRLSSNVDDRNMKRPWLVSPQAESFNRKYGMRTQDLIEKHWLSKSQNRRKTYLTSRGQVIAESSMVSLASTTRIPSPIKSKTIPNQSPKYTEALQKDTMINSNNCQSNRNFKKTRQTDLLRKLNERNMEMRERGKASNMIACEAQKNNGASTAPTTLPALISISSSAASTCSTVRLKTSRLPLHINSKKPINCSSRKDTKAAFEKSQLSTCSIESSIVAPNTMQRPKTSCGTVHRTTVKKLEDEEDLSRLIRNKRTTPRPRTCDSPEAVSLNLEDEIDKKKSLSFIRKESKKKKDGWQNFMPQTVNETTEEASKNEYRQHSELSTPRKSSSSKVKVAVNHGLKCYIDKLKQLLLELRQNSSNLRKLNMDDLDLNEVLTKEIEVNLNSDEIRELKNILQNAERKLALTNNTDSN